MVGWNLSSRKRLEMRLLSADKVNISLSECSFAKNLWACNETLWILAEWGSVGLSFRPEHVRNYFHHESSYVDAITWMRAFSNKKKLFYDHKESFPTRLCTTSIIL